MYAIVNMYMYFDHVFWGSINTFTAKYPSLELIITKILAKKGKLV